MANVVPKPPPGVADRIALKSLSKREAEYAGEVRRLIDAAIEVMERCGTSSRPRVSDIVAAAGLSNDAFYRHFPSKDALVTTIMEDGAERLASYLAHQMEKEPTAEGKVERWVAGVLSQADDDIAPSTRAVMWNGGNAGAGVSAGRHFASKPLAALLEEPLAVLGSGDPAFDALLVAHATLGKLSDYLWERVAPSPSDVAYITDFCVSVATNTSLRR